MGPGPAASSSPEVGGQAEIRPVPSSRQRENSWHVRVALPPERLQLEGLGGSWPGLRFQDLCSEAVASPQTAATLGKEVREAAAVPGQRR